MALRPTSRARRALDAGQLHGQLLQAAQAARRLGELALPLARLAAGLLVGFSNRAQHLFQHVPSCLHFSLCGRPAVRKTTSSASAATSWSAGPPHRGRHGPAHWGAPFLPHFVGDQNHGHRRRAGCAQQPAPASSITACSTFSRSGSPQQQLADTSRVRQSTRTAPASGPTDSSAPGPPPAGPARVIRPAGRSCRAWMRRFISGSRAPRGGDEGHRPARPRGLEGPNLGVAALAAAGPAQNKQDAPAMSYPAAGRRFQPGTPHHSQATTATWTPGKPLAQQDQAAQRANEGMRLVKEPCGQARGGPGRTCSRSRRSPSRSPQVQDVQPRTPRDGGQRQEPIWLRAKGRRVTAPMASW